MDYIKSILAVIIAAGVLSASLKNILTKRDIYLGSFQLVIFILCISLLVKILLTQFTSAFFN